MTEAPLQMDVDPTASEHDSAGPKPLVFFHVMKCAGTSVRAGLAGTARDHKNPEVFELDGEAAKGAAAGKDADNWIFRDALLSYLLRTSRPSVVLGHFRYRDRFESLLDSAHFVTVLRDPVERIVSLYKYRRYKDDVDVPISVGFDEFLATRRWSNEGHTYVRTFCGRTDLDPRSDEAISAAITNLQRFDAVGFTHRLDDFSRRVSPLLGRPVSFAVINSSPAPEAEPAGIDSEALERAAAVCAPDLQVFEETCSASA